MFQEWGVEAAVSGLLCNGPNLVDSMCSNVYEISDFCLSEIAQFRQMCKLKWKNACFNISQKRVGVCDYHLYSNNLGGDSDIFSLLQSPLHFKGEMTRVAVTIFCLFQLSILAAFPVNNLYDYYGENANTAPPAQPQVHHIQVLDNGHSLFSAMVNPSNKLKMGYEIYVSDKYFGMFMRLT